MASVQGNPAFTTGQVPTAAQWNAAWTAKQDALISTVPITGNSTVLNTACKYVVDTSSGSVRLIVPPSIGQSGKENRVRIVKKSATPNANQVIISDGTNDLAYIINENDAGGSGWLDVDADGTNLTNFCGVP